MKVLAIYRHYWPDTTPYARLLRAILEEQISQGHQVSVFTAQPSYNDITHSRQSRKDNIGGVDIRRISLLPERKHLRLLRGLNFTYFLLRAALHVIFNRQYNLIIANTHPPVLMGIALRLIKRLTGTEYLLHCQDIHPESAVLGKQINNQWLVSQLIKSDSKSCSSAKKIVTLSDDMLATLQNRSNDFLENIEVINNFPLDVYEPASQIPEIFQSILEDTFTILFAGNMGLFQDLSRLVETAQILSNHDKIRFVFMGAGAQRNSLKQQADHLIGKTVFFEPFQPVEVAFACMQRANLGVVSLKHGVCRVAYPSKTMTYLAAGCPLLLLSEPDSQLANDITSQEFGYVPNSPQPSFIAKTILQAYQENYIWNSKAREALKIRSSNFFGRDLTLAKWNRLFTDIESEITNIRFPMPDQLQHHQAKAA